MRLWKNALQYRLARPMLLAALIGLSGCGGTPKSNLAPPAVATRPGPAAAPPGGSAAAGSSASQAAGDGPGQDPHGATPAKSSSQGPDPSNQDPIGDAEAKEFVTRFDKALSAGDAAALGEMIDYEAMIRRALTGLDLPEELKARIVQGSKASSRGQSGEAAQLADRVKQGGKYHLAKIHKKGVQQRALYRFFDAEGRMNFTDYILARDAAGAIKVDDCYLYSFAELQTDELRRAIRDQAAGESPEYEKTLTAEERAAVKCKNELQQVEKLMDGKKFHEAIELYDKLPEILQKCHNPLILRIGACHAKKDQCDALVKLFHSKFPRDRGLKMWMAQYNMSLARWDEALKGVEAFDEELGGDPYLDAERAYIQLSLGNLAAAKKLIVAATAVEPDVAMVKQTRKMIAEFDTELAGGSASDGPPPPAAAAEAKAFAAEFVHCVVAGDDAAVGKCLDGASFYRRSTAKLEVPSELRLDLEANFRKVERGNFALYFHIGKEETEKGATFALLRLHAKNGEHRALFRHVFSQGGFAYCDCVLVHDADGKVRVADYLNLESGVMTSQVRSLSLADLVKRHKHSADNDGKPESEDTAALGSSFRAMQKAVAENRNQEALDIYNKLPAAEQKMQIVFVARIEAARQLKGEAYEDAVSDYREAYPDAANLDLIMIGVYDEHKQYDRKLTSIAALDESLGGDPYLDVVRAETYLLRHDLAGVRRCARKAIDADPTLLKGYKYLLTVSLSQKKYAETSQVLTALKKHLPKSMPTVESDPEYAGYVKSPQYRTWIHAQR